MLIKNIKWDTDGDMEALASLPTEVYTPPFGAISDSRRKPMMEELSNATRCPNEAERKKIS